MSDHREIRVLALPGSLRRNSYNRWLLEAASECVPASMNIRVCRGLCAVPLFDEDLEASPAGPPAGVCELRDQVAMADGLLIATPEYNQSLPGVLKNVLDWLSRPLPDEVLVGKPVAIMGATAGPWGTRLAQVQLRQVLAATESLVMPRPGLFVRDASTAFDAEGRLTDRQIRKALIALTLAFKNWVSDARARANARQLPELTT